MKVFSFFIHLTDPVALWNKHEGFCDTKKVIDNHLVVNDTAKCGIKLITDLNTRIVKDLKFTYLNAKYVMLNF